MTTAGAPLPRPDPPSPVPPTWSHGAAGEPRRRRGFTLLEMMIVVLIIGTVATILLPNYRRSVLKAQATDVLGKVEAINVALKDYESDHQSPPDGVGPAGAPPAWLVPYAPARWFTGPSGVTLQLSIAGPTAPTLVIAANSTDNQQILLAAAGVLGQRATVLGGGAQVTVTLTH